MVNTHTFCAVGCQQLSILVSLGVQIVNVNFKDTFDCKNTFIWCRGVPWSVVESYGKYTYILVPWGVIDY